MSLTGEKPMTDPVHAVPEFEPIAVAIPTAAAMIGISRSKFYELLEAGEIDAIKLGRRRLIVVSDLREFVEARRSQ